MRHTNNRSNAHDAVILAIAHRMKNARLGERAAINAMVGIISAGNAAARIVHAHTITNRQSNEPLAKKTNADTEDAVKMIENYQSNMKDDYIFCINTDTLSENEIKCKIGGIDVTATIDSGTKYNVMDVEAWEFLKANLVQVLDQQKTVDRKFTAYGGHSLTVVGIFEAFIETAHKKRLADFYVVKDYGKILIGYKTGIPLGVLRIGENVDQIEQDNQLNKIKDFVVEIPMNKEVKPVTQPYRRVPVPIEAAVDRKIEELLKKGIIEKVKEKKKSKRLQI